MTLRELRMSGHLTQNEASIILSMPLRTYKRYEYESHYENKDKYLNIYEQLEAYINKEKGTYSLHVQDIKNKFSKVFKKHNIELCILFGAYAFGTEDKNSSIDILIDSHTNYDVQELQTELSELMDKKVNVVSLEQIIYIKEILRKILKEGIKIYGN